MELTSLLDYWFLSMALTLTDSLTPNARVILTFLAFTIMVWSLTKPCPLPSRRLLSWLFPIVAALVQAW